MIANNVLPNIKPTNKATPPTSSSPTIPEMVIANNPLSKVANTPGAYITVSIKMRENIKNVRIETS